jgi:hypothetical protein
MRVAVACVCVAAASAAALALTDTLLLLRSTAGLLRRSAPLVALHDVGTRYMAALDARPLSTKCITALLLFAVADMAAQTVSKSGSLSAGRVARFSLWGALIAAPLIHLWYQFLNQFFTAHFLALGIWSCAFVKSVVDQAVYLVSCY